jgi:hypothetical protein
MRTALDFAPLFRSSIGFDRMLDVLETESRVTSVDNWPPYDIVKTGEDDCRRGCNAKVEEVDAPPGGSAGGPRRRSDGARGPIFRLTGCQPSSTVRKDRRRTQAGRKLEAQD